MIPSCLLQPDPPRHQAGASNKVFDAERSDEAAIGAGSSQRGSTENRPEGVGVRGNAVLHAGQKHSRAARL